MAITKEDIEHLGTLARIRLTDEEVTQFQKEVEEIIGYVSTVSEIAAEADLTKRVGPVHNVFRKDQVTEASATSEKLIEAFPDKDGRYLKVKRILNNDE